MIKDFKDMTKEELVEYIEQINEEKTGKYGLIWDKEKEPEKIVEECSEYIPVLESIPDFDICNNSEINNILIEGDNFHSLSVLNYTHKENIDLIYLDPPYNTGTKDFIYNDKFVDSDDGYRHSKWINFMSKRLRIAKKLLKENGIILISIDDNELYQLKLLCDKIFGEENFICNFIRTTRKGGGSMSKYVSVDHDYCLCYSKDKNKLDRIYIPFEDRYLKRYKENDDNGRYFWDTFSRNRQGSSNNYFITAPDKEKIPGSWIYKKEKFEELLKTGDVRFKKTKEKWSVQCKQRLNANGQIMRSQLTEFPNRLGTETLVNLIGKDKFSYAKPVELIKHFLNFSDNNAIVLDFFAGSGTTGQAVLELNKEDGGNRQFILCTNNENKICEDVTYPRLKTVITGIRKDGSKYSDGINSNLKYFKTNFVENSVTRDQLYYDLTEKCIPMLCVKENTFEEIEITKEYAIYSNKEKTNYTCVYFDIFGTEYDKFKDKIKNINEHKALYIFTLGEYINTEELKELKNYSIEPIPYRILDLYKKVVKMCKED